MRKFLFLFFFLVPFFGFRKTAVLAQSPPTSVGQCHSTHLVGRQAGNTSVIVDWGYPTVFWSDVETVRGIYNWDYLDSVVAGTNGKVWIQVSTSNPGVRVIPSWATDVSQLSDGYWFYGNYNGSKPVQWDSDYKRYLRELVSAMALKYDNNDGDNAKIEAVLVMAGGNYGEMAQTIRCCHGAHAYAVANNLTSDPCYSRLDDVHDPNSDFIKTMRDAHPTETTTSLANPYTDPETGVNYVAKFDYYYVKNTLELIDIYAQAFRNKAIVVQLGSGASCQFIVVQEVVRQAVQKYCNRVWLKQNGWGSRPVGSYPYYGLFDQYKDKTRTVLEVGNVSPWRNDPTHNTDHVNAALANKVSAVCFQGEILSAPDSFPIPYLSLKQGLEANYRDWFSHTPACNPTPSVCPDGDNGNLNCDTGGKINDVDRGILLGSWSPTGPVPTPRPGQRSANLNGDSFVNEKDLTILMGHWTP